MKKLLALGLSLTMMASLSAVAFAEEIVGPGADNPQSADVQVIVAGKGPTEPDKPGEDENWTVTIPATYQLEWDNVNGDSVDGAYSIKGQLSNLSTVTVTVTPYGEKALTLETSDKAGQLPATVSGDETISITGSDNTAEGTATVGVAAADFDAAFVGTYSAPLTFVVEYTNTVA